MCPASLEVCTMLNKRIKIYNKKEFISSACLLALGLCLFSGSIRLSVWTRFGPQEGFFPLVIALIIIALSLLTLSKSLIFTPVGEKRNLLEEQEKNVVSIFKVSAYAILMLLYWVLMERIGFLITSGLFLFLVLKYIEKKGWKITIWIGSASILISYLLFVYFLKVPLPKGFIKW